MAASFRMNDLEFEILLRLIHEDSPQVVNGNRHSVERQ